MGQLIDIRGSLQAVLDRPTYRSVNCLWIYVFCVLIQHVVMLVQLHSHSNKVRSAMKILDLQLPLDSAVLTARLGRSELGS